VVQKFVAEGTFDALVTKLNMPRVNDEEDLRFAVRAWMKDMAVKAFTERTFNIRKRIMQGNLDVYVDKSTDFS
jgi:hypothetical protein